MSAITSFVARHRSRLLQATTVWCTCGVLLYLWAPLTSPALLILGCVAPGAWYAAANGRLHALAPATATTTCLLAGIYLAINASWSLSPDEAYRALGCFFAFVAALHFIGGALMGNDADVLRAMLVGLCAGMAIGGIVLCFEVFSEQRLLRELMTMVPSLRPKERDMMMDGGTVAFLQPFLVNRHMAVLTFLFWPAALAALLVTASRWRYVWLVAFAPGVAAVLGSVHATSKVALLGSALVFGICALMSRWSYRLVAGAWVAVMLLVVPLATFAYQHQLYLLSWLPPSAQHRIVIWGHTSHLLTEAPMLGAGINTARALNESTGYDVSLAPGSDYRLTTSLHSHNVYLQTWYETGAVGAAFLLALGLVVLGAIARAPALARPHLYATFAACALIGNSSFSLWQPWFMAAFGITASFAMAGRALADRAVSVSDAVFASPSARPAA